MGCLLVHRRIDVRINLHWLLPLWVYLLIRVRSWSCGSLRYKGMAGSARIAIVLRLNLLCLAEGVLADPTLLLHFHILLLCGLVMLQNYLIHCIIYVQMTLRPELRASWLTEYTIWFHSILFVYFWLYCLCFAWFLTG